MSSAAETRHIQRVKELPCAVCGQSGPSDAHHILEGRTPNRKSPGMLVIPLCKGCHTGSNGIHGARAMWNVYKATELACLAETIRKIFYG